MKGQTFMQANKIISILVLKGLVFSLEVAFTLAWDHDTVG